MRPTESGLKGSVARLLLETRPPRQLTVGKSAGKNLPRGGSVGEGRPATTGCSVAAKRVLWEHETGVRFPPPGRDRRNNAPGRCLGSVEDAPAGLNNWV